MHDGSNMASLVLTSVLEHVELVFGWSALLEGRKQISIVNMMYILLPSLEICILTLVLKPAINLNLYFWCRV